MKTNYDDCLLLKTKRLKIKKIINITICYIIFALGIAATIYKANYEGGFFTCLREMTVDGTLFSSIVALVYAILNHIEIKSNKEFEYRKLYYLRLSSAVTGFMIMLIVSIGYLPFIPDHPVINRFDMWIMHLIIPLLSITSFIFLEPPIEKLKPKKRFAGLIFIGIYSVAIMTCIITGIIPEAKIPYSFLNIHSSSIWYLLFAIVFVYSIGYLLSMLFSEMNRRSACLWFHDIAQKYPNSEC